MPHPTERAKVEAKRRAIVSALNGCPTGSTRLMLERYLRRVDHALATWTNLSDAAWFGPNWRGPAIDMAVRDADREKAAAAVKFGEAA